VVRYQEIGENMRIIKNLVWEAKVKCQHCKSKLILEVEDIENDGGSDLGEEKFFVICKACSKKFHLDEKVSNYFRNFSVRESMKAIDVAKHRVDSNY
jgi:hypothetical protein